MTREELITWWVGDGIRSTTIKPESFWDEISLLFFHANGSPLGHLQRVTAFASKIRQIKDLIPPNHPIHAWLDDGVWEDFKMWRLSSDDQVQATYRRIEDNQEVVLHLLQQEHSDHDQHDLSRPGRRREDAE